MAGVVVSAKTGTPLGQTRVTLVNTQNRQQSAWVITREDGRFEFTGLGAGKYALQGARRGYIAAAYEQHEQYSTAIVTGEEFDTQNVTLRLVPMATLSGKVLDENGEGVRDADVKLYVESHRGGATRVMTANATTTDDQGTFEFTPLGPGKYYVSVTASPWYAVNPVTPAAGGNSTGDFDRSLDVAYPTTFSGGATESEGAEAITVKGGDRAQIDVHLRPVPALHVVFHVADLGTPGMRMPQLEKRLFDSVEPMARQIRGTQQQGSMAVEEIIGIPPGRYTVAMPGNGSEAMVRTEVELNQDAQNLDELKGEPAGRVKLSVKMPQDGTLPRELYIGLQDKDHRVMAFPQVDANGDVTFEDVAPGKYALVAFAPGKEYSVAHMSSGDTQVYEHELTVAAGQSQEWNLFLAEGKTRIEGFVKRGGKAASGVMVVLVPKDPETHEDMFRRDQSDSDGSFVLRNVIPGSYTVAAIENAWGFDWSKPALLAHYAEHGQTLTIGELMQGAVYLPDPVEVQPR